MENLTAIVYLITRLDSFNNLLWVWAFCFGVLTVLASYRKSSATSFMASESFRDMEKLFPAMYEFWKSLMSSSADTSVETFMDKIETGYRKEWLENLVAKYGQQSPESSGFSRDVLRQARSTHRREYLKYYQAAYQVGWSKHGAKGLALMSLMCFILALATPTTKNGVRILTAYGVQEAVYSPVFRSYASDIAEFLRYYLEEKGELAVAAVKDAAAVTSSDSEKETVSSVEAPKEEKTAKSKEKPEAPKSDLVDKTVDVAKAVRKTVDAVQEISDIVKK